MALQKNNLIFNFASGVNTLLDPFQVEANEFLTLENTVFDNVVGLKKRNGFGQKTGILPSELTTLATLNDGLIAVGNNLQAYSSDLMTFREQSYFMTSDVATQSVVRNSSTQTYSECAVASNSLSCVVYSQGSSSFYKILDTTNGQIVVTPQALPANISNPRVLILGNFFVVLFIRNNGGVISLSYFSISISNPNQVGAITDLSTVVNTLNSGFDAVVSGDVLFASYDAADVGGAIRTTLLNAQFTQGPTVVIPSRSATRLSIAVDEGETDLGTPVVYVTYYNGTNGFTTGYNFSLTVVVPEEQVMTSITSTVVTTFARDALLYVYYQVTNSYSYGSVRTDFISRVTLTESGTVGTPAVFIRGLGILSKPFYVSKVDQHFLVATFPSTVQPTNFVLNQNAKVVARFASGNAGGYLTSQVCPQASLLNDVAFYAYRLQTLLVPVSKEIGSDQTSPVYSQFGINIGSFDIGVRVQSSSEIADSLNLTGGKLWQYDGVNTCEQGFHLFPENLDLAQSNAAGTLTIQQYWYYATYEWTDAAGLIHRSAPSVPQTITLTGSNDTITVQIPTLRITDKLSPYNVTICLYRYSVAQPVPYLVTSITSPTLNNTAVDSVTFVDILPDSSILGNLVLYTLGGVVENTSPPASIDSTLFRSRLFVIDAEDRNRVWYSKQVIPNTPVEMSDLFTLYVGPTIGSQGSTGPLFCISSMDDKLILFKKNAIYYITGNGPDNTGANNDFSEPVFITSTVGCINPQSIVFTPKGMMFQSPNKGIWMLGRDLSTEYIGARVDKFNGLKVLASVEVPNTNQIRFHLEDNVTLVYDYFVNQWGTFTNVGAQSAVIFENLHTFLNDRGQIFQETVGQYLDGTRPVRIKFKTAWLKLTGLQGLQRVYFMYLLGQYKTPHKLSVGVAYDFNEAMIQQSTLTPSQVPNVYGDDPVYGASSPYGGESPVEQYRLFFTRQKCQSIQVEVSELFDATLATIAGEGLSLSGLNFVIGGKLGYAKLKPAQSFG